MDVYRYTDTNGNKHEVPRVRASSIDELQRRDHVAFYRQTFGYWHQAIVEYDDREGNIIEDIEYSNTAGGFTVDNSIQPKRPGKAKVAREEYQFQTENVSLIKYEQCLDPESVVSRAKSKLGERKYNLVTNNYEHFGTWCKEETPSSEQANKAVNNAKHKAGKEAIKAGLCMATGKLFTQTGEEIVKTGVRVTTKEVVTQTVSKAGQEIVKTARENKGTERDTASRGFGICQVR